MEEYWEKKCKPINHLPDSLKQRQKTNFAELILNALFDTAIFKYTMENKLAHFKAFTSNIFLLE